MSKIPTAEEYCEQTNRGNISGGWEDSSQYEEVKKLMVEFANLHVQAALEAAKEEFIKEIHPSYVNLELGKTVQNAIINAYPKENII